MSKQFDYEALMNAFPYPMSGTETHTMLAAVIAEALTDVNDDNELLKIYARIDGLDGELLDILAYDFKIDWWDYDADVETKRRVFKECWNVHRKLGTTGAVETAVAALYDKTEVVEWYDYNGQPYHYKIFVDLGYELMDTEKIRRIVNRARYYVNVRSWLDSLEFKTTRTKKIYIGCASIRYYMSTANVDGPAPSVNYYVDENGETYVDADGEGYYAEEDN